MSGIFIVIEGADGTGKSTHAKLLGEYLRKNGYDVVNTAEPTKGLMGKRTREVLSGKADVTPKELTLLFTEDRKEHVKNLVRPSLDGGKVVICERYFYSTIAYQSIQGVDPKWIEKINSFAVKPDLVILLKISPKKALDRMHRQKEVFEVLEFQEKVQEVLIRFAQTKSWVVVETEADMNRVQDKIRAAVDRFLEKTPK
ncbi:MAG: dTMP kinase [Candidatus Altiarchaeota archaeon]|nr:dTMP kinase [Candidatus Altiarchaeota archaeon]